MDNEVEPREKLQPPNLLTGQYFSSRKILKVFMIGDHINWCARTFQVVLSHPESIKNGKQLFVMSVMVFFGSGKQQDEYCQSWK